MGKHVLSKKEFLKRTNISVVYHDYSINMKFKNGCRFPPFLRKPLSGIFLFFPKAGYSFTSQYRAIPTYPGLYKI